MTTSKCVRCENGDLLTVDGFHLQSTGYYKRCAVLPPYEPDICIHGTPYHTECDDCWAAHRKRVDLRSSGQSLRIEVDACIDEIEWFATRKKNLSETVYGRDVDWASQLLQDIVDLKKALRDERAVIQQETNLHLIECNYRRGSIGGDGCICMVVNKNEIQRLISLEEETNQAFENAIRNRDDASAECEKLRTSIIVARRALEG